MKLSDIQVGKEYAVTQNYQPINNNNYYADIKNITRRDVLRVTVVNKEKHVYRKAQRGVTSTDITEFELAPKNAKTNIGILVLLKNTTTLEDYYMVVRVSEILVDWSVIEPLWLAIEAEQAKQKRIAEQQEEERQRKINNARLNAERARDNLPNTVKRLLGGTLYGEIRVDFNVYSDNITNGAQVYLSLRDMERLLELVYDKTEEVA